MSEGLESRPWYRLHWLTWVVLFLVGGSLVVENLVGQDVDPILPNSLFNGIKYSHGWPIRFVKRDVGGDFSGRWPIDKAEVLEFRYLPLMMDILIALVILLATSVTTESYLRRQPRWQFSIQSIMLFTVFVALLMMNIKYDFIRWHGTSWWQGAGFMERGDAAWEYIPFIFIALGLWCVFWTAWRLVAAGVERVGGGSEDG